jgi:hypothetical protein
VRQYRAVRKDRKSRDAWEGVKAWQSELEKQRQFLKSAAVDHIARQLTGTSRSLLRAWSPGRRISSAFCGPSSCALCGLLIFITVRRFRLPDEADHEPNFEGIGAVLIFAWVPSHVLANQCEIQQINGKDAGAADTFTASPSAP